MATIKKTTTTTKKTTKTTTAKPTATPTPAQITQMLNKTAGLHIYWLFIYAIQTKVTNPEKLIRLCPWAFYTPYKNKALPTFVSEHPLDMNADEDLNRVLESASLGAHVVSASEVTLSRNTRVWLLEVPPGTSLKPKYHCHSTMCFYTKFQGPLAFIRSNLSIPPPEEEDNDDDEDEDDDLISEDEKKSRLKEKQKRQEDCQRAAQFVPTNGAILRRKIKVNLGHNMVLKTNVPLQRLFPAF